MSDKPKVGSGKSGWCLEGGRANDAEKHRACIFKACTCECHGGAE